MDIIFVLIGCSVFMALIFLGAFFWANITGQHRDTYTPSLRVLFDDEVEDPDAGNRHEPSDRKSPEEEKPKEQV